jgi:hypothetical protein
MQAHTQPRSPRHGGEANGKSRDSIGTRDADEYSRKKERERERERGPAMETVGRSERDY